MEALSKCLELLRGYKIRFEKLIETLISKKIKGFKNRVFVQDELSCRKNRVFFCFQQGIIYFYLGKFDIRQCVKTEFP